MRGDRTCPNCGQTIPRGTAECPICHKSVDFYLRRETLLLVSFIGVVLLFVLTGFVVKWYSTKQRRLGWQWYTQGETDLHKGKPAAALFDFRNALFHQPGDPSYQLRLAAALVVSGRLDEAQSYLSRLWDSDPANGPVNLELGLLAMKRGNLPQTITYFHNAIDGVWDGQADPRWRIREQLCEYLIDQGHRDDALAELTALSAETPDDAARRTQVANLFAKVGDNAVALKEYERSLRLNPKQPQAWLDAGKAALALGDYRTARSDLGRAVAENRANTEADHLLRLTNRILQIEVFDRHVTLSERSKRTVLAFQHALTRLSSCAAAKGENLSVPTPQTELQGIYAEAMKMKPGVKITTLRHNPDLIEPDMNMVFRIERLTAARCGAPSSMMDQALLAIAGNNGGRG
jgi:tetratricopeptide (TPR) repeat protein